MLQHWSAGPGTRLSVPRDDLAAWYRAGDTRFDLSDLGHTRMSQPRDDDEIQIEFADETVLRIIEVRDLGST